MNPAAPGLSSIMPLVLVLTLLVVLALAVRVDALQHRIPNALTALAAAAGLLFSSCQGGVHPLLMSLAGIAAGMAIMLPFYALRGMGAGDVKLMGAVGSFIGPQAVLFAAGATLLIGCLLGLGIVMGRFLGRAQAARIAEPAVSIRKEKFPYAVAIAGGSLIALTRFGQLDAAVATLFG